MQRCPVGGDVGKPLIGLIGHPALIKVPVQKVMSSADGAVGEPDKHLSGVGPAAPAGAGAGVCAGGGTGANADVGACCCCCRP